MATTTKTLTYTLHLEPAEEGGYTVTVPALPAIVTEVDTYEEALAMARDAIDLYLAFLKVEGRPIPIESPAARAVDVPVQVNFAGAV